jgi:hypothetical protein
VREVRVRTWLMAPQRLMKPSIRLPSEDTRIFWTRYHQRPPCQAECTSVRAFPYILRYISALVLPYSLAVYRLRWGRRTPLILMIFFGPPAAVPIDGLSSHKTHLTLGRTRASDSMTFLQVLMMVAGGVEISEAYLTGIYYISLNPTIVALQYERYP